MIIWAIRLKGACANTAPEKVKKLRWPISIDFTGPLQAINLGYIIDKRFC